METDYLLDEVFGERLLISHKADKNELSSNIRAARAILSSLVKYASASMRILTASDIKIRSIRFAMTLETQKE